VRERAGRPSVHRTLGAVVAAITACLLVLPAAYAQVAATDVQASDIPNDDGSRGVQVTWQFPTTGAEDLKGFVVLRRPADGGELKPASGAKPLAPKERSFADKGAAGASVKGTSLREPSVPYVYVVRALYPAPPPEPVAEPSPEVADGEAVAPIGPPAAAPAEPGATPPAAADAPQPEPPPDIQVDSSESAPAKATGNWYHTGRTPVLLATILFAGLLLTLIQLAKAGKTPKIRRIPGLEAVDEAIGRATEMGRPILYVPGIGGVGSIATMSAMNIYGHVAKKAGELGTAVRVPCRDAIVMQVMRTVGEQAYTDIGRPDAYRSEDVFFVTDSQFAYAAAVDGIMVREKPSAIFLQGVFYAESLILAETGNSVGAIQIAGTDRDSQVPFFLAACDYTLIGEELFAASAYLSHDIPLLSTIRAQDIGKAALMIALIVGVVLQFAHIDAIAWFFDTDLAR